MFSYWRTTLTTCFPTSIYEKQPTKRIPWDYIIEQEEKMNVRFINLLAFSQMFQLNKQVNKRKWLTNWIEPLLHKNEQLSSIYIH